MNSVSAQRWSPALSESVGVRRGTGVIVPQTGPPFTPSRRRAGRWKTRRQNEKVPPWGTGGQRRGCGGRRRLGGRDAAPFLTALSHLSLMISRGERPARRDGRPRHHLRRRAPASDPPLTELHLRPQAGEHVGPGGPQFAALGGDGHALSVHPCILCTCDQQTAASE